MPTLSIEALLAFLRAQDDPDAVLRNWDLELTRDAMQSLREPGSGTVVIQSTRKGKKKLRTLQARAIAEAVTPAEGTELPSGDEEFR